jgi:hypothetical protein
LPRKIKLTEAKRAWLKANHASLSVSEISAELGCCSDTAKRILMREGLSFFSGAKFVIARTKTENDNWTRPCIVCGCAKSRPRWQYRCDKCTEKFSD